MYLPPLQAMHDSQVYVSGDVTIHPSAAIAPGVMLQAPPGSKILIAAGVCIGMGAVLHSCEGMLEIQEGANLGAGVLIVGCGTIGANACIGSSSTLLNASVLKQTLVPSGSILGDGSRQIQLEIPVPDTTNPHRDLGQPTVESPPSPAELSNETSQVTSTFRYPDSGFGNSTQGHTTTEQQTPEPNGPEAKASEKVPHAVHGQAYVNSLLSTLLPNRNGQISPPSSP